MTMISIETSAKKVKHCWKDIESNVPLKQMVGLKRLLRLRDVPLPLTATKKEEGFKRSSVAITDIRQQPRSTRQVDKCCRRQDLHWLRYEKIYYEKSLVVRKISILKLVRKLPYYLFAKEIALLRGAKIRNPKKLETP